RAVEDELGRLVIRLAHSVLVKASGECNSRRMTGLRVGAGVAVAALCLGTAACGGTSTTSVTGSGSVVSRDIPVSSFSRLEVGRAFDVRVSVGAAETVTVHVDDNLVEELDVGVSGDTLHVDL